MTSVSWFLRKVARRILSEQLERIARNKQIALQRRKAAESKTSCASTPPAAKDVMEAALAMPTSWKDKLHGEFSKEYFKKLCNFHSAQVLAKKVNGARDADTMRRGVSRIPMPILGPPPVPPSCPRPNEKPNGNTAPSPRKRPTGTAGDDSVV